MKFLIEGLGLTAGGGKTGLLRLLPALARQGAAHTFVALLADLEEFRSLERPNLKVIPYKKPASLLRRHLHLQRTVPRICAQEGADALLCLGNFGPRPSPVPTVVFLHNAEYVCRDRAAARATSRERLITHYARSYLRRLPEGVHLVVQSEVMKKRAMAARGVPTSKITVIRDGDGLPIEIPAPGGGSFSKRQRSGDSGSETPFSFLCVARYYPHKNLEVLPEAMKRLPAYTQRPARCLVTIDANQHSGAQRLLRRIGSQGLEQAVINIGPLDGNEVVEAYRSADALILPSLLESFGRTYLEAMRFDLPILTSDRDFAHEVCRGAALYFDPLDPESVARSMARIMDDAELCQRLAAERRRIVIPSWDEVAARFLEVLEHAASSPLSSIAA